MTKLENLRAHLFALMTTPIANYSETSNSVAANQVGTQLVIGSARAPLSYVEEPWR